MKKETNILYYIQLRQSGYLLPFFINRIVILCRPLCEKIDNNSTYIYGKGN